MKSADIVLVCVIWVFCIGTETYKRRRVVSRVVVIVVDARRLV